MADIKKIKKIRLAGTDYDIDVEKDWQEFDPKSVTYIKNRTHYQSNDYLVYNRNVGYEDDGEFTSTGNICGPVILPHPLIPNTPYTLTIQLEYSSEEFTLEVNENYTLSVNGYVTTDNTFTVYEFDEGLDYYGKLTCQLDKNELIFTPSYTRNDTSYPVSNIQEMLISYIDFYGLKTTPLNNRYIQIGVHQGDGENSVVQNDGLYDGSGYYTIESDPDSNWTNATHAAVFGNNNRVIATVDSTNDADNSFIGGGLSNKIYSKNSVIGGGKENTVGSSQSGYSYSGIIAGYRNNVTASYGFIGSGTENSVQAKYSAIVGGSSNTVSGQYSGTVGGNSNTVSGYYSVAGGQNNVVDSSGAAAFGINNSVTGKQGFTSGLALQSTTAQQAVFGRANAEDGYAKFIIGNGTVKSDNTANVRENIFVVDKFGGTMGGTGLKRSTAKVSAYTDNQSIFGAYNAIDTSAYFIVGNGTSDANRKNALVVHKDGRVTAGADPSGAMDLTTKQYVDNKVSSKTDTKNTTGATDTSNKIYLVGATSQDENPETYTHDTAYVGPDGCLYSDSKKVAIHDDIFDSDYWNTLKVKMSILPDGILGQMKYGGVIRYDERWAENSDDPIPEFTTTLSRSIVEFIYEHYPELGLSEEYGMYGNIYFNFFNSWLWFTSDDEESTECIELAALEGCYFIAGVDWTSIPDEIPKDENGKPTIEFYTGDWIVISNGKFEVIKNTDAVRTVKGIAQTNVSGTGDIVLSADDVDAYTKAYVDELERRIEVLEEIIENIVTLGVNADSNGKLTITPTSN